MVGSDIGGCHVHLVGMDPSGRVFPRKHPTKAPLLEATASLPPYAFGIEACRGATPSGCCCATGGKGSTLCRPNKSNSTSREGKTIGTTPTSTRARPCASCR